MTRPARWLLGLAALAACGGDDAAAPADAAPRADAAAPIADAAPHADADLRPGASCDDPLPLTLGVDTSGDTTGYPALLTGCAEGSDLGPELSYRLALGDTPVDLLVHVAVDESVAAPYDVVAYVKRGCASGFFACADAGWGERVEPLGLSGDVLVVVDGTANHGGAAAGAFQLSTATRAIVAADAACDPSGVASRCPLGQRCVTGQCQTDSAELACSQAIDLSAALAVGSTSRVGGYASRTGDTHLYLPSYAGGTCAFDPSAPRAEDVYRIDLASPATLTATTDFAETDFDTVLYLRSATCAGPEVACADDVAPDAYDFKSRLTSGVLPAGTYFLYVDGSSGSGGTGHYRVDLTELAQ